MSRHSIDHLDASYDRVNATSMMGACMSVTSISMAAPNACVRLDDGSVMCDVRCVCAAYVTTDVELSTSIFVNWSTQLREHV